MTTNVDISGLSLQPSESLSSSVQAQAGSGQSDGDRVQDITMRTGELLETINQNLEDAKGKNVDAKSQNKYLIWNHLSSCYGIASPLKETGTGANELLEPKNPVSLVFDSDFEWINTEVPPNLAEESTRSIVILEFFTHCCINCIHSIEDVRHVYTKLKAQLKEDNGSHGGCQIKIISVHSPKFTREKDTDSIRAFVKRNRMTHTDVVNDPDCKLWNALSISCWPTLLIFGLTPGPRQQTKSPKLNLIFTMLGEGQGHKEGLETLLQNSLEFFNSKIDFSQLQISPAQDIVDSSVTAEEETLDSSLIALWFPGKVSVHNDKLVISDSGNNRLILCTEEGQVKEIIGGVQSGCVDGDFTTARFYNPQGVAFRDEFVFYVADTGNHCVRQIDLRTRTVSTLVEPHAATADNNQIVHLKSPWDLAFYGNDVLLIAAAGNHQIFCYTFASVQLFSVPRLPSSFDLVAGTGKEENRNNMYIRKASFCQPSGICVSHMENENDKVIYVADSESSTIRMINSAGRVMPFVGGTKDPTDLFAYGDVDGCSYDVRLQHPVGVCSGPGAKMVFIADTYNHKIKMIDRDIKLCATVLGTGTAGNVCGAFSGHSVVRRRSQSPSPLGPRVHEMLAQLNEPNGVSINQEQSLLYIADTNNHSIKVAHLYKKTVTELKLSRDAEGISTASSSDAGSSSSSAAEIFDKEYVIKLSSDSSAFSVHMNIYNLPTNLEGGEWRLGRYNEKTVRKSGMLNRCSGAEIGTAAIGDLRLPDDSNVVLQVNIFFCGASSCYRKTLKFHLRVEVDVDAAIEKSASEPEPFVLDYHPPADFFREA